MLTALQAALLARLADYPQQARQNMHHAAALVPTALAAVLQHDPQLVSAAVEAFYYRDNQDVAAARQLCHFDPEQACLVPPCFHEKLTCIRSSASRRRVSLHDCCKLQYIRKSLTIVHLPPVKRRYMQKASEAPLGLLAQACVSFHVFSVTLSYETRSSILNWRHLRSGNVGIDRGML